MADADTQRSTPMSALSFQARPRWLAARTSTQTLESLVGTAAAAVGASNAAISLQDPDRPGPELTFTIGLDEAGQAALGKAAGDTAHPLTAAAIERREVVGADTVAFPLIVSRDGIEQGLGAITFGWPAAHVGSGRRDRLPSRDRRPGRGRRRSLRGSPRRSPSDPNGSSGSPTRIR